MIRRLKWSLLAFFAMNFLIGQTPIDPKATRKTRNLLSNLKQVSEHGFLFGHEDSQAYGVGWREQSQRSDVKSITGSFPAIHGWDLGRRLDSEKNIDSVRFDQMIEWIKGTYKRKGINTISWHLDNLTSGGNSWDKKIRLSDLLPGGSHHDELLGQLDLLANFFDQCRVNGVRIPIIFRPWHEHNGNWFWWGKGNCSEQEYIDLYRFTVDYLRHTKKVHQLLYCFSPDRGAFKLNKKATENYLYGYPGSDYVDIIGLDNYIDVGGFGKTFNRKKQHNNFVKSLELITQVAEDQGKVAALTETGLEGVKNHNWFTESLLTPILENRETIRIAWILVWRNANEKHHYAAYPGHPSEPDFLEFAKTSSVYLEIDLQNPYKKGAILEEEK